ncbi:MAG: hypothetical protein ACTSVE_02690 [Candidatus Helarchaeota archaeon]
MEALNQIEEKLKSNSKKEIRELVENFLDDVDKNLNKKYGGIMSNDSFYVRSSPGKVKELVTIKMLENIIYSGLVDRHLKKMVKKKSNDLIQKLDMLND